MAFTGTIKDDILPQTEVAYQLLKLLLEKYRNNIQNRYGLTGEFIENILSRPEMENINIYEIMKEIGKKRGCLNQGNKLDDEKIARVILEDFRSGKIGKITLETVK